MRFILTISIFVSVFNILVHELKGVTLVRGSPDTALLEGFNREKDHVPDNTMFYEPTK